MTLKSHISCVWVELKISQGSTSDGRLKFNDIPGCVVQNVGQSSHTKLKLEGDTYPLTEHPTLEQWTAALRTVEFCDDPCAAQNATHVIEFRAENEDGLSTKDPQFKRLLAVNLNPEAPVIELDGGCFLNCDVADLVGGWISGGSNDLCSGCCPLTVNARVTQCPGGPETYNPQFVRFKAWIKSANCPDAELSRHLLCCDDGKGLRRSLDVDLTDAESCDFTSLRYCYDSDAVTDCERVGDQDVVVCVQVALKNLSSVSGPEFVWSQPLDITVHLTDSRDLDPSIGGPLCEKPALFVEKFDPVQVCEKVTLTIPPPPRGGEPKLIKVTVEFDPNPPADGTAMECLAFPPLVPAQGSGFTATYANGIMQVCEDEPHSETAWNGLLRLLTYENKKTNPTEGIRAIRWSAQFQNQYGLQEWNDCPEEYQCFVNVLNKEFPPVVKVQPCASEFCLDDEIEKPVRAPLLPADADISITDLDEEVDGIDSLVVTLGGDFDPSMHRLLEIQDDNYDFKWIAASGKLIVTRKQ